MSEPADDAPAIAPSSGRRALRVALGILSSRLLGFVRDRLVAHFFGVGAHADVFRTALRGPNLLQNLLGEGTISATFIPVYSRLLRQGREEDAGRLAGAVFGLLVAAAAGLTLIGAVLARPIVAVLAPGFLGDAASGAQVDRFALAVTTVRIMFPMAGLLVLSAWALGVLNSHRRFFLPYFAPVLWNAAIIAALLAVGSGGAAGRDRLLIAACVGALVGGGLQFAVQLPLVARLVRGFRVSFSAGDSAVRETLRGFVPVVAARGVVQIGAYLDGFMASFLAVGAVAALGYAQALYVLPISLFAMSVAAAELPELAAEAEERHLLLARLARGVRRTAFWILPAAVGYLAFGLPIVGALYRTGSFGGGENVLVYLVLSGYSLGLLAAGISRVLASFFYATRDPRTPSRVAGLRVLVSAALSVPAMLLLDRLRLADLGLAEAGSGLRLGAVGLALASGVAAWVELARLLRVLATRLPELALPWAALAGMLTAALAGALPAGLAWWLLRPLPPALLAPLVLPIYGLGYLGAARALGIPEARDWLRHVRSRRQA
jgi:putative peptidoglycan lipid II flippase